MSYGESTQPSSDCSLSSSSSAGRTALPRDHAPSLTRRLQGGRHQTYRPRDHRDREEFGMASLSERENREIEAANASGSTPVVFIHGLWLLPSSWDAWADFFRQAGYAPLTPDWPDDPATVEAARAEPEVVAKKTLKQVADHTTEIINALNKKPVVMGHSTGGLLAQMLAGRGLSAVTVAIDPGVFRGVLPLPASALRA